MVLTASCSLASPSPLTPTPPGGVDVDGAVRGDVDAGVARLLAGDAVIAVRVTEPWRILVRVRRTARSGVRHGREPRRTSPVCAGPGRLTQPVTNAHLSTHHRMRRRSVLSGVCGNRSDRMSRGAQARTLAALSRPVAQCAPGPLSVGRCRPASRHAADGLSGAGRPLTAGQRRIVPTVQQGGRRADLPERRLARGRLGGGEGIRTPGLFRAREALYRTEPHPQASGKTTTRVAYVPPPAGPSLSR
jgi:hypothetical protein